MATWIQYPQWALLYLCIHIHIYTNAGFLGIKLGTVIRDRAAVIKINTLLASCKQTSAFPSELPRMRLWEHTWCAKSSLFIPASRGNQEQAQSQNYRSDIWISDLSPHSAPGIGLVSSIVWDISVTSEISTNPTFVPLERRKCGCHGTWQGWGGGICCLKWTSCDYPSPPRASRLSEPHWVRTQGHHATLLGLLWWDTTRVFGIHLFHRNVRRKKKDMLQPILLSGKKNTK